MVARHPLDRLHPGGGDECREAELVCGGDGPYGPPPGAPASGGDGCRRIAPLLLRPQSKSLSTNALGIAERQSDETRAFARLHSKQQSVFALLARVGQLLAHV